MFETGLDVQVMERVSNWFGQHQGLDPRDRLGRRDDNIVVLRNTRFHCRVKTVQLAARFWRRFLSDHSLPTC